MNPKYFRIVLDYCGKPEVLQGYFSDHQRKCRSAYPQEAY